MFTSKDHIGTMDITMIISILKGAGEMSIALLYNMDTDTPIEDGTWHIVTTEPLFMIEKDTIMDTLIAMDTMLWISSTDTTDITPTGTV